MIPGFIAEAALHSAGRLYRGPGLSPTTDRWVHLADWVDQACLSGCLKDCGLECAGTSGQGKAFCIHECARDNADCRTSCTRPGDPPPPPPPPPPACGTGSTPCAGGCCPPGFPSCTFSGTTAVCCPGGFSHSVTVFGVNICLP